MSSMISVGEFMQERDRDGPEPDHEESVYWTEVFSPGSDAEVSQIGICVLGRFFRQQ